MIDSARLRSWSRPRSIGRRRAIALHTAAGLFGLLSVMGLIAHFRAPTDTWQLAISALAPYLMVCSVPALAVWTVMRHWLPAAVALVALVLAVGTQVPLYTGDDPPAHGPAFVVMTANLRIGDAKPASVIDAVRNRHVDLLAVEELTPAALARLHPLDPLLPYHEAAPAEAGLGTGLWSRYPLTDIESRHDFGFNMITARASVPGRAPIAVAAVHMCGPVPDATCWLHDIRRLPLVLRELAGQRTAIVAGDFNSTTDVAQFRRLLTDGYADATEQAGAGWLPTYPADQWFPPVIPIDHVLTRGAVATDVDRVDLAGSDHRGLVARVRLG